MILELITRIFQNILIAGLLCVLVMNLGGRNIPSRYKKNIFVVILVILLMGMVSASWASVIARVSLTIVGIYFAFKYICK